jgi:hypothetical protein
LAKTLAEKERVANRTEEEVENEKEARAAQAAQRKKDRDIKLADEVGNLVEGRSGSDMGCGCQANYGQWNERSGD